MKKPSKKSTQSLVQDIEGFTRKEKKTIAQIILECYRNSHVSGKNEYSPKNSVCYKTNVEIAERTNQSMYAVAKHIFKFEDLGLIKTKQPEHVPEYIALTDRYWKLDKEVRDGLCRVKRVNRSGMIACTENLGSFGLSCF